MHRLRVFVIVALGGACGAPSPAPERTIAPRTTSASSTGAAPSVVVSATTSATTAPTASAIPTTTAAPTATAHKLPTSGPCAPQKCTGQGMCDAYFEPGWLWNGKVCVQFSASGCGLVGPDCGKLTADEAKCKAAHAACS